MADVGLKDLVAHVRAELESLDRERQKAGREALFELESLELELKCTVTENTAIKGGIDIKVASIGAEMGDSGERIQTITLKYRVAQKPDHPMPLGARGHSSNIKTTEERGIEPLEQ